MAERLDSRSAFPSGMEEYLEFNGWHFNKKMCQWAVSNMYKKSGEKKEFIEPYTLESLEELREKVKIGLKLITMLFILQICVKQTSWVHLFLVKRNWLNM